MYSWRKKFLIPDPLRRDWPRYASSSTLSRPWLKGPLPELLSMLAQDYGQKTTGLINCGVSQDSIADSNSLAYSVWTIFLHSSHCRNGGPSSRAAGGPDAPLVGHIWPHLASCARTRVINVVLWLRTLWLRLPQVGSVAWLPSRCDNARHGKVTTLGHRYSEDPGQASDNSQTDVLRPLALVRVSLASWSFAVLLVRHYSRLASAFETSTAYGERPN